LLGAKIITVLYRAKLFTAFKRAKSWALALFYRTKVLNYPVVLTLQNAKVLISTFYRLSAAFSFDRDLFGRSGTKGLGID
jgi:hypothetical protein